jgi:hypothetical protein
MFKGNSIDFDWPTARLSKGSASERKREREHQRGYSLGKTCADCGKPIHNRSTYCVECSRSHRKALKCGPSGAVDDADFFHSRLYNDTLDRRLSCTLGLPRTMCVHFGTMACLECDKAPPPWCPALDGHPEQQCETCTAICPCNGTMKGDA